MLKISLNKYGSWVFKKGKCILPLPFNTIRIQEHTYNHLSQIRVSRKPSSRDEDSSLPTQLYIDKCCARACYNFIWKLQSAVMACRVTERSIHELARKWKKQGKRVSIQNTGMHAQKKVKLEWKVAGIFCCSGTKVNWRYPLGRHLRNFWRAKRVWTRLSRISLSCFTLSYL